MSTTVDSTPPGDPQLSLSTFLSSHLTEASSTLDASARKALSFGFDNISMPPDLATLWKQSLPSLREESQRTSSVVTAPALSQKEISTEKPALSYAKLAALGIAGQPNEMATVAEIYKWVMTNYPYFKQEQKPWWKVSLGRNADHNNTFISLIIELYPPQLEHEKVLRADPKSRRERVRMDLPPRPSRRDPSRALPAQSLSKTPPSIGTNKAFRRGPQQD